VRAAGAQRAGGAVPGAPRSRAGLGDLRPAAGRDGDRDVRAGAGRGRPRAAGAARPVAAARRRGARVLAGRHSRHALPRGAVAAVSAVRSRSEAGGSGGAPGHALRGAGRRVDGGGGVTSRAPGWSGGVGALASPVDAPLALEGAEAAPPVTEAEL